MKVTDILKQVTLMFSQAGLEDPGREALILVREVSGIGHAAILARAPELTVEETGRILDAASRRAGREPLQYITGTVEFMDLTLNVGPGVLVPRPETELLVEEFFRLFPDPGDEIDVLDLCTGSGCIALSIASHYTGSRVTATDDSEAALKYARDNARSLAVDNVEFLLGPLYSPVGDMVFDAIVSNPPYIPEGEIDSLMPEVGRFEPRSALDGGLDGLDFYRAIIEGAKYHIKKSGLLLLELGAGQRPEVEEVARDFGLTTRNIITDIAGHERVLVLAV